MSDEIVLELRSALTHALDLSCIVPDQLAELSNVEIGNLQVWSAASPRRPLSLGEVFRINGERSTTVRLRGDCRLAEEMGREMKGGRLYVEGSAGSSCGLGMQGGLIRVMGDAGSNLGGALPGAARGMTGGEIIVFGSVGPEVGARMRRGMIYVGGGAGERAGRGMIAGTLVVGGKVGPLPGAGSKRGSLVALSELPKPDGYWYACTYRPPHVPLILTRLRDQHGAPLTAPQISGEYRRYSGDLGELGKGEILSWTAA